MTRPAGFLAENAPWLLAGVLLTFASSFGQTFFISVFAGEIRADFGLSHGEWGGLYALATTSSAAVMVFAGSVTDRYRVRFIGAVVILGLALAAALMSVVTAVWALGLSVFLLRLLGQGMMTQTAMVAMARWFVASRGRAVSIAGLGVAFGEALLPLLFVALLGVFDWRLLWLVAAVSLVVMLPFLSRLLRLERTPQSHAEDSASAGLDGRHWTRREMLGHPMFWAMVPMIMGPSAFVTALFFHQVHISEVRGWSHAGFVALFPLYTGSAIAAMLAAGWAVDRFGSARLIPVYLLPMAAGFMLLGFRDGLAAGAIAMMLVGSASGANNTMSSAFWAEHFGTRHLGSIRAAAVAVMVLGTALGPALTGAMIDRGVAFPAQGPAIGVFFLAATLLAAVAVRRARR